jgi:hypothetical protein
MSFLKLPAAAAILLFASACEGVTIEPLPEDQQPKQYNIPSI